MDVNVLRWRISNQSSQKQYQRALFEFHEYLCRFSYKRVALEVNLCRKKTSLSERSSSVELELPNRWKKTFFTTTQISKQEKACDFHMKGILLFLPEANKTTRFQRLLTNKDQTDLMKTAPRLLRADINWLVAASQRFSARNIFGNGATDSITKCLRLCKSDGL